MSIEQDVISKSVTADDIMAYQGKGVVNFVMPYFWATPRIFALPTDLPPYWSYQRDVVLRNTILYESYWAGAVTIAINKVASQSFDVQGDVPRRVVDAQEMIVEWGGESYVMGMSKLMMDFFTTDNGAFVEIVRQSSAAGSKIIGIVHLDSLRCQRTGDPEMPILFRDLKGGLHELQDYQVMEFTDMPDPGYSWLGVGHCAAERAFDQIYKVAGMTRTLNEKITGAGAHQLAFLQGIGSKQMAEVIATAQSEAASKGLLYYLGTILAAIQGDLPVKIETLQLRGLPENFDQKVTLDLALLAYANALGLVLTDLQPLSGQGLGTGAQTVVLEEKAQGRTIATFRKMFTHKVNEWIMPDKVTFAFKERDLRDEQQQAAVALAREQVRASMITAGEVTAQEARQLAVDSDDLPKEFIQVDVTGGEALGDEERGEQGAAAVTGVPTTTAPGPQAQPVPGAKPGQPAAQGATPTGPAPAATPQTQQAEAALEKLNLNGIQITSAMGIVQQVAAGSISREQGADALQILLNLSEAQARRLIGGGPALAPKAKEAQEVAALYALRDEIAKAREALVNA